MRDDEAQKQATVVAMAGMGAFRPRDEINAMLGAQPQQPITPRWIRQAKTMHGAYTAGARVTGVLIRELLARAKPVWESV